MGCTRQDPAPGHPGRGRQGTRVCEATPQKRVPMPCPRPHRAPSPQDSPASHGRLQAPAQQHRPIPGYTEAPFWLGCRWRGRRTDGEALCLPLGLLRTNTVLNQCTK